MRLSGGEAVIKIMQSLGIEYAFGMGGFQHLPFYHALARQSKIRHILIRDERSGAFMADAYARVSSRVAVCDATVGPGVTNLVSGLAESYYASIPVLAITSDVNSLYRLKGANQECNQVDMFKPITKDVVTISHIQRIPELIKNAVLTATTGRPGPVLVNIPEDVFHSEYTFAEDAFETTIDAIFPKHCFCPDQEAIKRALHSLRRAERPVILSGGGSLNSKAFSEVEELSEVLQAPIATTMSGKGIVAEDHPLSLNVVGRWDRIGNQFIEDTDLLLVLGSRLGQMATKEWSLISKETEIIQVDIDPTNIGKNYPVEIPLCGDVRSTVRALLTELKKGDLQRVSREEEIQEKKRCFQETIEKRERGEEDPLNVDDIIGILNQVFPPHTILVADGGFSAHWSSLYYDVKKAGRQYVVNRGQAAIGYGLPGAIGAKLAAPDELVVALVGDGGLGLSLMDLETALRVNAPLIVIVVNNNALGYVKALQYSLYRGAYISVDLTDVDYSKVAEAFGCIGERIRTIEKLKVALEEALKVNDRPVLLDVMVTKDPAKMLPGRDPRTEV